jgi:CCR4-NOT complex subunit CAF16
MPVPVSTTHNKGHGLDAQTHVELPTSGSLFSNFLSSGAPSDSAVQVASRPVNEVETSSNLSRNVVSTDSRSNAIETKALSYQYCDIDGRPQDASHFVIKDMSISIPRGSTVLLIGPNGAGKTTLLKVLAGKHMVPEGSVAVLGSSPFHNTSLTTSGSLNYVGGNWERDVAFAGYSIPLAGDIPARQMLNSMPGVSKERIQHLVDVLDIDPEWRMHLVSDGQRRRVQIAMGLLKPFDVLLLDEITVDLDVLGRADLMKFLKEECAERNATVVYATHIFDGLESWPSHIMYVAQGKLHLFKDSKDIPELSRGDLLGLVEGWLREERNQRLGDKVLDQSRIEYRGDRGSAAEALAEWNNGWKAGRMTSSLKQSSNAVLR